jgi:hypothetical protein
VPSTVVWASDSNKLLLMLIMDEGDAILEKNK